MEQSSFEKQLRCRQEFDSCCKAVLKNEMIDYERARSYRLKHEKTISELSQEEWNRLYTMDEYTAESEIFRVLDMTDTEIARHLKLVRSTIHHHRASSLQTLKKIMEGIRDGENR